MKTKKAFLSLLLVLSMLSSLMVAPVSAAAAPKLTITPSVTTISKGTGTATVVYTIEIDPNGNSVGAFAFELHAPEGMTLSKTEVEEKDGAGYWTNVTELMYMPITGYKNNPFSTFEYAPASGYFGAAGSVEGRTLTTKKTVMTIQATVDISADKTYTLGVTKFLCGDVLGNSLGGDTPTVGNVTVGTPTPPTTDKYTVNFSAGDGTGTMTSVQVPKAASGTTTYALPSNGGTFTPPAGKAFRGWFVSSVGFGATSGAVCHGGQSFDLTNDIYLTALWGTSVIAANFTLSNYAVGKDIVTVKPEADTATATQLSCGATYGTGPLGDFFICTDAAALTGTFASAVADDSTEKFVASTTYYLVVALYADANYSLAGLTKENVKLDGTKSASALLPMSGDGCQAKWAVFTLDPIAHTHSFTVEDTAATGALKSAANCKSPAVYYKSCTCGAVSTSDTDTFTFGAVDVDTHIGAVGGWTNVGDTAKHYKTYAVCGHNAANAPHAYTDNFDAQCNDCSYERTLYTVTFDKGDTAATGTMTAVKVIGSYSLPACGFTAPGGKQFGRWLANGVSYDVGDTINVTSDVTVTADWQDIPASTHSVTVQNDGNGTASASATSAVAGTAITLTYSANTGFHFKEWQVVSGGVTISGNSFTMPDNDVTVKAIFEADAPITAVSFTLGGYAVDSKVTEATLSIAATPTGALATAGTYGTSTDTCYMIGTGYDAATHKMSGQIENTSVKFAAGADYYLAVVMYAKEGYAFTDSLTASDVKLGTKSADDLVSINSKTMAAVFKLDTLSGGTTPPAPTTYTVTVNGSEATTSGAGSYAKDATVTISAGTKSGCIFGGWTTTDSGVTFADANNANTTFTMPDHAVTVTANWLTLIYSADYTTNGYTVGEKITDLTISGGATGIKAPGAYGTGYTVYKAAGMANAVTVGSDETFAAGTDYWLKIQTIPETGYTVNNLNMTNCKLDGESAINIGYQFYLFKLPKLTAAPAGTHSVTVVGGGTGATGADNYSTGATVTINAGTKDGYVFKNWTTSDGVTFANADNATTTFAMPDKNVTVTANWLEKVTAVNFSMNGHTLGATITDLTVSTSTTGLKPLGAYGTSSTDSYFVALSADGATKPAAGATFAADTDYYLGIYIEAADGYTLTGLTTSDVKLGTTKTAINLVPGGPYVCAVFKLDNLSSGVTPPAGLHTVTVQTDGNGTASASPATGVAGTTITLSYSASTGFHFKEWQVVSGTVTISGNSFTMPDSDVTVKAIFEADATPPAPTHTHTYGAWSKDATNHWHECTDTACPDKTGSVKDLHAHTYDNGADTDCNDCGYIRTVSPSKPSGGSSSSSSRETTYPITVKTAKHGDVSSNRKSAASGATVTITVDPDKGYDLETLTVLDKNGKEIKVTAKNGKYTFKMPASKVTVEAVFAEDNSMLNFFVDVPADAYYADAVLWAAENGITGGVDEVHFAPNAACTRAQIVTFLWRAAGSPAPKTVSSFTDVSADAYYADAVAWAVENGITGGMGDGRFAPNATCTRAQAVTFLYRAAGSPAVGITADFSDVAETAYYANAVAWAAENGITGGIGGGLFGSNNDCTRAQIVTFLYRSMK